MEHKRDSSPEVTELMLHLSASDYAILEKFRGDLTPEAFISALLRMIDSGAVMNTPPWVKPKEDK
jgi:hypothetical protein